MSIGAQGYSPPYNPQIMGNSMSGSRGATGNKVPSGYRQGTLQQFTPEQMELFKNSLSMLGPDSEIARRASGSDEGFKDFEEFGNRKFQEFSGENASRFSGLGMGARRGSGFQNNQTQGAQDFASQLGMQRQEFKRQALQDLMEMSGMLLGQRPHEQFIVPKSRPFWKEVMLSGTQAAGQIGGQAAGAAIMAA